MSSGGWSNTRLRHMHDVMAGYVERGEMPGLVTLVSRRGEVHVDAIGRFGHDAGDFVLSSVAREMTKHIRLSDMACRYGGEEMAVVLVDTDLEHAMERAEALRQAIRETNLTHRGQSLPAPTASFGVAVYPQHGTNIADFVKAADRALYAAKEGGRDRVCRAENTPAA